MILEIWSSATKRAPGSATNLAVVYDAFFFLGIITILLPPTHGWHSRHARLACSMYFRHNPWCCHIFAPTHARVAFSVNSRRNHLRTYNHLRIHSFTYLLNYSFIGSLFAAVYDVLFPLVLSQLYSHPRTAGIFSAFQVQPFTYLFRSFGQGCRSF